MPIAVLVALAMFSNLFLGTVPPFSFFDATMQAPILVTDTAMVSAVLLLARASQEFFLFFFFILIMAAKIENLVALLFGAALIGLTSLLFADIESGHGSARCLMRIPFLLATALFYGYVVLPERTGQMTPLRQGRQTPRPAVRASASTHVAPRPAPQSLPISAGESARVVAACAFAQRLRKGMIAPRSAQSSSIGRTHESQEGARHRREDPRHDRDLRLAVRRVRRRPGRRCRAPVLPTASIFYRPNPGATRVRRPH